MRRICETMRMKCCLILLYICMYQFVYVCNNVNIFVSGRVTGFLPASFACWLSGCQGNNDDRGRPWKLKTLSGRRQHRQGNGTYHGNILCSNHEITKNTTIKQREEKKKTCHLLAGVPLPLTSLDLPRLPSSLHPIRLRRYGYKNMYSRVCICMYVPMAKNKHEEDIERHRRSYRQEAAVTFLEFQKSTKAKSKWREQTTEITTKTMTIQTGPVLWHVWQHCSVQFLFQILFIYFWSCISDRLDVRRTPIKSYIMHVKCCPITWPVFSTRATQWAGTICLNDIARSIKMYISLTWVCRLTACAHGWFAFSPRDQGWQNEQA